MRDDRYTMRRVKGVHDGGDVMGGYVYEFADCDHDERTWRSASARQAAAAVVAHFTSDRLYDPPPLALRVCRDCTDATYVRSVRQPRPNPQLPPAPVAQVTL